MNPDSKIYWPHLGPVCLSACGQCVGMKTLAYWAPRGGPHMGMPMLAPYGKNEVGPTWANPCGDHYMGPTTPMFSFPHIAHMGTLMSGPHGLAMWGPLHGTHYANVFIPTHCPHGHAHVGPIWEKCSSSHMGMPILTPYGIHIIVGPTWACPYWIQMSKIAI